jgi:hypothetical protein
LAGYWLLVCNQPAVLYSQNKSAPAISQKNRLKIFQKLPEGFTFLAINTFFKCDFFWQVLLKRSF